MKCMKKFTGSAVALSVGGALVLSSLAALASDHREAPGASALVVADIGDYYAWHDDDTLNMILTFSTFAEAGVDATYSSDVLYTFHFDTTGDNLSDVEIYTRFAQDTAGDWGLQITGISDTPIVGAVDTTIIEGDISAFAGSTDDPFFFDQEGFRETLSTGTIAFDPDRDSVAGFNVTSLVLQAPLSAVVGDVTSFQTWATTGTL